MAVGLNECLGNVAMLFIQVDLIVSLLEIQRELPLWDLKQKTKQEKAIEVGLTFLNHGGASFLFLVSKQVYP